MKVARHRITGSIQATLKLRGSPLNCIEYTEEIYYSRLGDAGALSSYNQSAADDPQWIVATVSEHPTSGPRQCVGPAALIERSGAYPVEYIRDNVSSVPLADAVKCGYGRRYGSGYCTVCHDTLCACSAEDCRSTRMGTQRGDLTTNSW